MSDALADSLNKAAVRGDSDTIRICHSHGNDLNVSDSLGCTPLITASMFGRTHVVDTLLNCGANIEARDTWGNTPLLRAAQEGRSHTVALLLEKGANPNVKDRTEQRTPLIYAALRGHRDVVIQLLQYGCDVAETDSQGLDAYGSAKKSKHRRIADILKSHQIVQPGCEISDYSEFTLSDILRQTRDNSCPETMDIDLILNAAKKQKLDPDVGGEIHELRSRVDHLEEKVTVLTENIEEQNVLLRGFVCSQSSRTTSRSSSYEEELLSDSVLYRLTDDMGNEWLPLGNLLGFSRKKLEQLQADHPNSIQNAMLVMLQKWRDSKKQEDYEKKKILCEAFEKVHRRDLAHILHQLT